MDSYCGLEMYWVNKNFHFLSLKKSFKVRDIFPLLYPKMSRFSSLETIIVFCITYLETEFASHPERKVCSIV